MMGERRALLDPEMYKISEEDSQDEEVLSSGKGEKAGHVGGGVNGNSTGAGSSSQWRPRGSGYDSSAWLSEQGDDCDEVLSFPGNHVSSSFNSSEFRIGHGIHHQHLKQRSTAIRGGMRDYDDNENSLDWPDTSTNSDSYESDRDGHRLAKDFQGAKIDERSKTYFGDHLANRQSTLEGESLAESSLGSVPRSLSGQVGRRSKPKLRSHERDVSSSGSDYSGHEQRQGDNSETSSSGSSSDDCTDCVHTSVTRRYHSHTHSRPRRASSSEVEEYDSSYSDSSYDDTPLDDYTADENTGYSDSDNEWTEYFENPNNLLNERDVELCTTDDGELFLIEYSEEDMDPAATPGASVPYSNYTVARGLQCSSLSHADASKPNPCATVSENSNLCDNNEGTSKHDYRKKETISSKPGGSADEKLATGKSARGKISRLLKRKREPIPPATTPASLHESGEFSEASQSTSQLRTSSSVVGGSKGDSSTAPEKVFRFKDEHAGETRTVYVDVPQSVPNGNLLGRRATLIESFLGIIPGHFSSPPTTQSLELSQHNRIMVAGFVPDGISSKYRRIKIGDWLQSIDDIPVDHENVDQVLTSRLQYGKRRTTVDTEYLRLKLILKRVAGCMVSLPSSTENLGGHASMSYPGFNASNRTYITRPCLSNVSPQVRSNVAILYISSGSTNSANDASSHDSSGSSLSKSKDVVYSWPPTSESKMVRALAASQGLFSTVYRLLWDVAGSHPTLSKVVVDDCEMDVTYSSDDHGESLLLIGVATSLSTFTMHHNMSPPKNDNSKTKNAPSTDGAPDAAGGNADAKKREKKIRWREPQSGGVTVSIRILNRLESLIKYQFGSFARAFQHDNADKMERILANALSALNDLSEEFLYPQVPGNFIRLPNFVRSGVDDIMYSFETSDAMNWDKINRRIAKPRLHRRSRNQQLPENFYCHGSCLLYKGRIIASHLENDLTSSFYGWWRTQMGFWQRKARQGFLDQEKPVSRLAVWQQTNLQRKTVVSAQGNDEDGPLHGNEEDKPNDSGNQTLPETSTTQIQYSFVRCFSGLVGLGHFTLGFVLEEMADVKASQCVYPSMDWLRRGMATLNRLDHSAISQGYECVLENRNGREDFVELAGSSTASYTSTTLQRQEMSSNLSSSKSSTSTLTRQTPVSASILKNTEPSLVSGPAGSMPSPNSSFSSGSQQSSQYPKAVVTSSASNTSISSSSSIGGGVPTRSSLYALEDLAQPGNSNARAGEQGSGYGSDECADALDLDDTTTGTGSDNSSFKWYERAANELSDSAPTTDKDVKHIRVTRGSVLLDYLQVEFGRGVLLTYKDNHDGWAAAVRHNFRQTVTIIHQILHKASAARQRLEERGKDRKWVSLALAPISEHGIMFNCQLTDQKDLHKKKTRKRNVNYWVVGRIYPDEREIYVCYEDGHLSQNLVEIAYKVALNVFS